MAQLVAPPVLAPTAPTSLPIRAIAPWAAFFGVLMLVMLYFVSTEQSATALLAGETVHEWVHDGRHLLGFPCH